MCFPSSQGAQAEAWPQCPGLPHGWQGQSDGAELLLTELTHVWWNGDRVLLVRGTNMGQGMGRESPDVLWHMMGRAAQ